MKGKKNKTQERSKERSKERSNDRERSNDHERSKEREIRERAREQRRLEGRAEQGKRELAALTDQLKKTSDLDTEIANVRYLICIFPKTFLPNLTFHSARRNSRSGEGKI